MSAELLDQAIAFVRAKFTPQELRDVKPYEGEFTVDAVSTATFASPAVHVAALGWRDAASKDEITGRGARMVHLVAFVAVTINNVEQRNRAAMLIADKLHLSLERWRPASTETLELGAPELGIRSENLSSTKLTAKGTALWMVTWRQGCRTLRPPDELVELLGIDITSTVQGQAGAGEAPDDTPLTVTHAITFEPTQEPV